MEVFNIKNNKVELVDLNPFKLEKDIQEVAVFLIQVQKDLISLHNNQS